MPHTPYKYDECNCREDPLPRLPRHDLLLQKGRNTNDIPYTEEKNNPPDGSCFNFQERGPSPFWAQDDY